MSDNINVHCISNYKTFYVCYYEVYFRLEQTVKQRPSVVSSRKLPFGVVL
jgi:hypothetical protein